MNWSGNGYGACQMRIAGLLGSIKRQCSLVGLSECRYVAQLVNACVNFVAVYQAIGLLG